VFISDSYIETRDDCIVLKTTGRRGLPARAGRERNRHELYPGERPHRAEAGNREPRRFPPLHFCNCVIRRTRVGLGIYAEDGGTFEAVSFSGITMETYPTHPDKTEYPIFVDLEKHQQDSRQAGCGTSVLTISRSTRAAAPWWGHAEAAAGESN
jgi:hypothetical protein